MQLPLHNRPGFARASAGNITPEHASSELRAVSGMSVQVAEGRILCTGASSREEVEGATLEKGRMPVKVRRMAPFLRLYSNREAALLLEQGFTEGFRLHSHLRVAPPIANNLRSSSLHSEAVAEKII